MDGTTTVEPLPALKDPTLLTAKRGYSPAKLDLNPEVMSVTFSPDVISISSDKFPSTTFKKGTANRYKYASRTAAYGTPEVVKNIFTGQLPPTYFNDICYGKPATPREFFYKSPTKTRERELWEPKQVSREQARHVIRDIQDARFRRRDTFDQQSLKKALQSRRKTVHCLLKSAETMPHGKEAFLTNLEKEKEKCVVRCRANKKTREAMIRLEQIERKYKND